MGQKLQGHIETWKRLLFDMGKRNRLINYKDSKTSTVRITSPSIEDLYSLIAVQERSLEFPYTTFVRDEEEDEEDYGVVKGDVETNKEVKDLQKILKRLRDKAKTSIEERGVNVLFLAFGMLKWTEREDSSQEMLSPIVLVPVTLTIESLTSPYVLSPHEDEIVVNPTLLHKLQNDFGLELPEFDSANSSIESFFADVEDVIKDRGWSVESCACLGVFSFLKVNMYKDLEKNGEKLEANQIVSAIVGESVFPAVSEELNDYDHDAKTKPIDTFQVVDADSSQQDAILLSKNGVSFVLQGPPGTGKSQTITNIISEALADGKKVLFVSEKMAALQVVYNRLADVGLADYCLALHNPKQNKKDILRELSNSLSIDRKKVREEALTQLDFLARKRQTLNDYQNELHTQCSALNRTIFEINGKLAKLESTPNVIFDIAEPDKVTQSQLSERIYLLKDLSKTIGKKTEDYSENVWRGANVEVVTNQLRQDIDFYLSQLIPVLQESQRISVQCAKDLVYPAESSLNGLAALKDFLDIAKRSPQIPESWIRNEDMADLENEVAKLKSLVSEYEELYNNISPLYSEKIWTVDTKYYLSIIESEHDKLAGKLTQNGKERLAEDANALLTEILSARTALKEITDITFKFVNLLQLSTPNTLGQISSTAKYVQAIVACKNIKPVEGWFDINNIRRIKDSLQEDKAQHDELVELRKEILANFDRDILSLDFYPMLQRFRTDYNSVFRIFKGSYRADMRLLKSHLSQSKSFGYSDALDLLNSLKNVSDTEAAIDSKKNRIIANYGSYYAGTETKWDELSEALNKLENVIAQSGKILLAQAKMMIEQTVPYEELEQLLAKNPDNYLHWAMKRANELLIPALSESSVRTEVVRDLDFIIDSLHTFIDNIKEVNGCRQEPGDYRHLRHELNVINDVKQKKAFIEANEKICKQRFGQLYNGFETDWEKIAAALTYAKELKEFAEIYKIPNRCIGKICTDKDYIADCGKYADLLYDILQRMDKSCKWFFALFENPAEFKSLELDELIARTQQCKDRQNLLEEWVDYQSIRKQCNKAGLSSYIVEVENNSIEPDYIVDIYLKRFYNLWLDAVLPGFPSVLGFREKNHEQTIAEFRTLDKEQFKIARARVRERINARIPDFNRITSTNDEIGILKREVNKQRKIMPLRKLFSAIPNLLTVLRPCFMMSPLSVSVFLEADCYNFDLVIFDEASQVHTEDAIGAIMRGSQVIIVGDTKQLPPTNFFVASVNGDDYDTDDEDSDAGAYESILDEAVVALPERSLRWHYRSKHEHLIAFSNIKIYNGSLITFPSAVDKAPDCGVEYIYVKDGVYDRSGKRCNKKEADRVTELVFEHYRKHPERSLGIVTFSEAQQNAIDAAIRQKRLQNPDFERFFSEDNDEPFFIKNLENVQGDERDTIIFSIGYAKDANGVMYMNFGPLSREGGYRRLNVAITRAKYNVKLVGSIHPTDIDLEKTSAEGVRMLRSYIEFAQQGFSAIENEITLPTSLEFDSPFEEAVYDFLQGKGYQVVTQVGCSGYRIDMAVKHRDNNGMFAIGIECDGATYHSSRTARERDRLRQSVLESMGWRIHRIWSTDWIKSPQTEKEKLINVIEDSFKQCDFTEPTSEPEETDSEESFVEIVEEAETPSATTEGNIYGFVEYQAVSPMYQMMPYLDAIREIVQTEQPICLEEICKKMAPFFGRQKVTSVVRTGILNILRYELSNELSIDNEEFVRTKDFVMTNVRIPDRFGNNSRPINCICKEELALAMKSILNLSIGITPDDLISATSRELGFKHMGETISSTLRTIYNEMVSQGIFVENNGKVALSK